MKMKQEEIEALTYRIGHLAFFETVREPLLALDDRYRIIMANPAFYRAFHVKPKETIGHSVFSLGNGQWEVPELRILLEDLLPKRKAFDGFEVEHDFPNVGRRIFLLNAREIVPESAVPRLILLAFEDVTDKTLANRLLTERSRDLERSNIDLQQFANSAAHDLQSPLNKILAYIDLLVDSAQERLTEKERTYAAYLKSQPRRMLLLIKDLLTFAKVAEKDAPFEEVDLKKVVKDVCENLHDEIQTARASIEIGDLPIVKGRKFQLRQLFLNLVGNSLKYRNQGVPPAISISAKTAGDGMVELAVQDNGLGFEPHMADKIFEPLLRLHGSQYSGSGMGLSICRRVAELHGGTIRAEGEPLRGAKFTVSLPSEKLVAR